MTQLTLSIDIRGNDYYVHDYLSYDSPYNYEITKWEVSKDNYIVFSFQSNDESKVRKYKLEKQNDNLLIIKTK